ncbi:TPA: hypothetical protein ACG3I5_003096 [Clostridioides difficile]
MKANKKRQSMVNIGYMTIITIILVALILIIAVFFIIENNIHSKGSNDGWLSFFGSYFGGIIGGIGTLTSVIITMRYTEKSSIESRKEYIKDKKEDDRKIIKPYLNFISYNHIYDLDAYANFISSLDKSVRRLDVYVEYKNLNMMQDGDLCIIYGIIKNIGLNSCTSVEILDLEVAGLKINNSSIKYNLKYDCIEKGEEIFLKLNLYNIILESKEYKNSKEAVINKEKMVSIDVKFGILYCDLLENKYMQNIDFVITLQIKPNCMISNCMFKKMYKPNNIVLK